MKHNLVADGPLRWLAAQKAASREAIEKKYAAELAQAGPSRKLEIRKRMAQEYLARKSPDHRPSPGTRW